MVAKQTKEHMIKTTIFIYFHYNQNNYIYFNYIQFDDFLNQGASCRVCVCDFSLSFTCFLDGPLAVQVNW